jgi:ATP-dependent protease ClpP protease subunit
LETLSRTKYTNKLIGNTAFMLLNKPIGLATSEISGPEFANEVYEQKGLGHDVKVKINSFGGNVFQGWDMVDSIIETKAKTECIGVAYSMAGICLAAGSYRTAYPHSKAMIHGPRRADGKEDNSEFMTGLKNQFIAFLKNHTKFTEAEITDMVTSSNDYYFDAKQMLEKGIIDAIVPSNQSGIIGMSDKGLYEYCNQLIEQEQNLTIEMEILAKLFGGKTESDNLVSAVQMKAENETLKSAKVQQDSEIVALKAEVASLKAEKGQTDLKVKAAELIENAVKAGKFPGLKAEDKAKMIEGAIANYDSAKIMVDSIATGKTFAVAASAEGKKPEGEVTYEWLMKNNPTELARIAESDEDLFKKLQDGYIQAQKEKK